MIPLPCLFTCAPMPRPFCNLISNLPIDSNRCIPSGADAQRLRLLQGAASRLRVKEKALVTFTVIKQVKGSQGYVDAANDENYPLFSVA